LRPKGSDFRTKSQRFALSHPHVSSFFLFFIFVIVWVERKRLRCPDPCQWLCEPRRRRRFAVDMEVSLHTQRELFLFSFYSGPVNCIPVAREIRKGEMRERLTLCVLPDTGSRILQRKRIKNWDSGQQLQSQRMKK